MSDRFLTREVTRRDFNAASLTALFVGMSVWVGACGSSGSSSSASPAAPTSTPTTSPASGSGTTGTPTASDKAGTVGSNHGHAATVTGAQLLAGGGVTLHIQGSAGHDHTVDLTAGEVGQIASGTRVAKNSSTDSGHDHAVTFN
jgi:hypothetical protein